MIEDENDLLKSQLPVSFIHANICNQLNIANNNNNIEKDLAHFNLFQVIVMAITIIEEFFLFDNNSTATTTKKRKREL